MNSHLQNLRAHKSQKHAMPCHPGTDLEIPIKGVKLIGSIKKHKMVKSGVVGMQGGELWSLINLINIWTKWGNRPTLNPSLMPSLLSCTWSQRLLPYESTHKLNNTENHILHPHPMKQSLDSRQRNPSNPILTRPQYKIVINLSWITENH